MIMSQESSCNQRPRKRPRCHSPVSVPETIQMLVCDDSSIASSSGRVSTSGIAKELSPMAQWAQLYFRTSPSSGSSSTTGAAAANLVTAAEVSEHSMLAEDHVVTEAEYYDGETTVFDDDDSEDDDYDSDYDSDDSAEETRLAQELVRASFGLNTVAPKVAKLVGKRVSPTEHLKTLVPDAQFFASHSLNDFFEPKSDAATTAFTLEVAQAIRQDDAATLERLWLPKTSTSTTITPLATVLPSCGTPTGDSIVHLACRRNAAQVLSFLLQHGVSVRYRGDYCGRTPLHEACWSAEEPQWTAVIDKLLDQCPDLLYITDRLGATALDYIPLRHYDAACKYLDRRGAEKLRSRELQSRQEWSTCSIRMG